MKQIKRAVYAGTFDLFTNGHADIVTRSLKIFDELVLLVALSPTKRPLFNQDQRIEMLKKLYIKESRVKVDFWDGLVVEYAQKNQIGMLVRGLRPLGDFETEFQMATMNNKLYPEIETIFLATSGENYFISSSFVKEVLKHKGNIEKFVPPVVFSYVKNNLQNVEG
ncbi:MAG: pantetheine-phosphate adenylyltransferase [Bdellovibrionales bacterium RIFOXYD12_FULL_39_22]|nr:MAG: pantetheine-phosphate adenylyltransferase [Bdellovibrionales bacterium RIFOXYB1_FULL_39_21]OFZ41531.1 MAG: pantetheine-phosphate adenylyltransferase [Bdellovibrionales bacterium RIFOXYC12_FULL_39_17]OFZ45844.1 MAG: pantetheine-phosphate adenylyltransferase [Bdellovibrionales bacterium RIFOXYC1_FULL_39_130]OFZ74775.1 MAG: pantetheine-phosphate adenylyltransferase [Bdellovibrionales bacterium RIFOXYD1_FULL_39_84]OFZ75312.1 MAG: pantetheine-phosphate adenylyltransferase [Bdellovibrionales 